MMLQLILMTFLFLLLPQTEDGFKELPAWASAPSQPNLFVVKTEEFKEYDEAVDSLLPTVREAVVDWSKKNVGSACRSVIESMPLDDFKQFVHKDQEVVHHERRKILNEYDVYYRGYVRVSIDKQFFESLEPDVRSIRLKSRLCWMLFLSLIFLGSLGILWCWFFMRHKSRGLYIKRIRWIIGGLIVLQSLVCYFVFRWLF